jgi:hypothetical protein
MSEQPPALRASTRMRSNSIGLRWMLWPSRRTSRAWRSTSSPSTEIVGSSSRVPARRRAAFSRATSSRAPKGLVT